MEVTVAGKPDNSNNSVGRATKKVCRRSEVSTEPDDPLVDENGQQILDLSLAKASYNAKLLDQSRSAILEKNLVIGDESLNIVDKPTEELNVHESGNLVDLTKRITGLRKNKLNANGNGVIHGNVSKVGLKVLKLISDNVEASNRMHLRPTEAIESFNPKSVGGDQIVGFHPGHATTEILAKNPEDDEPMGQLDLTDAKVRVIRTFINLFLSIEGSFNQRLIEANGFSGGIWILWNEMVSIDIFAIHPQMVHMKVCSKNDTSSFLCIAVYASA
ncbi:hypothetical protein Gotri_004144 [Gossypium trilobum]|uniref:Uncharacterized protein n=1 Tax=Gossypium trilobum TaxID=34281 RepID=A0A7J9F3W6_9ROSI|nr:hypothetical protein [Gossypium trilobum]